MPLITAEPYFGFVTTMFLAFGLVMEFPFVVAAAVQGRDRERRAACAAPALRIRRYLHLRRVVTPGGDPFSPTIMTLVMYPLYELTIFLVGRSNRPQLGESTEEADAQ